MNFQNEHAHTKEVNQDGQKMPVEVYASTLSPDVIWEDLRFAERQLEQGISRLEATGKSVIAVERASQLSKEGKRVLFLCFNELLANHVHTG